MLSRTGITRTLVLAARQDMEATETAPHAVTSTAARNILPSWRR